MCLSLWCVGVSGNWLIVKDLEKLLGFCLIVGSLKLSIGGRIYIIKFSKCYKLSWFFFWELIYLYIIGLNKSLMFW